MKAIGVLLFVLVAGAQAISFFDLVIEEWDVYKAQHKKKYETDTEEKFRMKIFMDNRHKIAKHNMRFQRGEVSYELGLNKYADMLHHEFIGTLNGFNKTRKARLLGGNGIVNIPTNDGATYIPPANVVLPTAVNWADLGAVTPIKDQGACGSCWAFSSTGSLEGQHFRKTGKLVSLSEQNLIDCSTKYGNNGCNGGLMDFAFKYVRDNKGIDTEATYTYEAADDKCRYTPKHSGATDVGFVDLPSGDEESLKGAVATVGPISIAIDASHESFQFYKTGVYVEPECLNGTDNLDHGVLLVGYGTDEVSGQDYWLVKNSWGTTWGLHGYIKMARNKDNQCGVATSASYPLV